MSRNRVFGRQYVIRWDDEIGRYHVTLGNETIGFHGIEEGAMRIARTHARRVTIPSALRFSVNTSRAALSVVK